MRITTIIAGALIVVPSLAAAEGIASNITFERHEIPASGIALAQSKIIYLNHTGVTLRPGDDDARTNHSSIVSQNATVPAWNTSAAHWQETVACMKDMFKRWDVVVTDVDPGNTPHIEAVFGGSPQNVGMGQGVGGVSPFTQDCGIIENSIVFTFTSVFPDDPQTVCEVMAQEVAHSYGLDHEMLASDPMTYLDYNGDRSFKDQTVSCGEYNNRACGIGGFTCRTNQNSVQLLNQRLGMADLVAPTLGITSPADGDTVKPGFAVDATASDNIAVTQAQLYVDDQPVGMTAGAGPYSFATDAALPEGLHTIAVEVTDGRNPTRTTITVTIAKAGGGSGSGSGSGSGDSDGDGVPDGLDDDNDDGGIIGGCNSGRDVGLAVGLFVLANIVLRRRRYE